MADWAAAGRVKAARQVTRTNCRMIRIIENRLRDAASKLSGNSPGWSPISLFGASVGCPKAD
jgi:hypothetical protein